MTSALCFLVVTATLAISGGAQHWQRTSWQRTGQQPDPILPGQAIWLEIKDPQQSGRQQPPYQQWSPAQSGRQQPIWELPRQQPNRQQPPRQQPDRQQPPRRQPDRQQPPRQQPDRRQPDRQQMPWQQPDRQQPPRRQPDRQQLPWQQPDRQQPNRQQPDRQQPPRRQPDRQQPPRQQPDRQQPPRRQPDRQQPDRQQPPRQQPDRQQPPRRQPDRQQPDRQQPPRQQPDGQQPPMRQPDRQQPPRRQPDRQQPPARQPDRQQTGTQNIDYCNLKFCPSPRSHTRCKFSSGQTSPVCGEVKSSVMTAAEIKEVLDKHNELRAKVARGDERRGRPGPQPAAKDIRNLRWNSELAETAQIWANQCVADERGLPEHDKCRATEKQDVGQNIGYSSSSGSYNAILSDIVTAWYDEVENFDSREVAKFKSQSPGVTGHYSQFVWGKTTEVGCGVIRHNHPVSSKGYFKTQLVCNYAARGNWIDEPVYQIR